MNMDSRSTELRRRILSNTRHDPSVMSIDGLLDAFVAIYDECCNPSIREEKAIGEFLDYGKRTPFSRNGEDARFLLVKFFLSEIKHSRFRRNDFDAFKTIGRGAFGEGIGC